MIQNQPAPNTLFRAGAPFRTTGSALPFLILVDVSILNEVSVASISWLFVIRAALEGRNIQHRVKPCVVKIQWFLKP